MGHPKKPRKQYNTPSHPWNADRIKEENRLASKYGLKNKKEIWKAESRVERYRRDARILLGMDPELSAKERGDLLGHLVRAGIISPNAELEEVLDLNVEDVLRRRLQSLVYKNGLSHTAKEARLFVVHGHITLNGKKISAPGHLVAKADENNIDFYPGSPVAKNFEKNEADVEEVSDEEVPTEEVQAEVETTEEE